MLLRRQCAANIFRKPHTIVFVFEKKQTKVFIFFLSGLRMVPNIASSSGEIEGSFKAVDVELVGGN